MGFMYYVYYVYIYTYMGYICIYIWNVCMYIYIQNHIYICVYMYIQYIKLCIIDDECMRLADI